MPFVEIAALLVSCLLVDAQVNGCWQTKFPAAATNVAGAVTPMVAAPIYIGPAFDAVLTAQAVLAWDETSNSILYQKNIAVKRPVASLSKILASLVVRDELNLDQIVEIPKEARKAQTAGADIQLPIGQHARVFDLLSASLVASANDAMVTLAIATAGSEDEFVETANSFAKKNGAYNTKISNATGLQGGDQYSTAKDIKTLFTLAYRDKVLRNLLVTDKGVWQTQEGKVIKYHSTNELLGTYFPVLAAKTGFTHEAGENLAVMTYGDSGQKIGVVVLGSEARFQDAKTLVEWIWRNYQWP